MHRKRKLGVGGKQGSDVSYEVASFSTGRISILRLFPEHLFRIPERGRIPICEFSRTAHTLLIAYIHLIFKE